MKTLMKVIANWFVTEEDLRAAGTNAGTKNAKMMVMKGCSFGF